MVQGNITYVNDKFCEIAKYNRAALLGRNHRILNSGWHPIEFFRHMYHTIGQGGVWRGELRNRNAEGEFYWVDTTIVPFLDDRRKPYQYIAIRYDITERMQSELALREQAALAQLGQMAAVMAHEVRNPLAGIRGALQVIGRRLDPQGPERGIIDEVISRVDGLNNIVHIRVAVRHHASPATSQSMTRDRGSAATRAPIYLSHFSPPSTGARAWDCRPPGELSRRTAAH